MRIWNNIYHMIIIHFIFPDYWDVTNSKVAYNGTLNLVIKNVGSLEICWDMCSSYIGFECL